MKKVLVTGSFNVVHPGHLRLLRFAKECGDKLIVGVLSDEIAGSAAHVIQDLRMEGVRSISWVDEVVLVDQSIESVILEKRPNVIVKGREYEKVFNLEKELVENYGGKIIFSSGEVGFSSLDLIRKESLLSAHQNIVLPELFMDRHNIDVHKLTELIHNFSKVRVCIVGDLIVDEYINCQPLGMSQEDPTIVVTPVDNALYLGGAAIVAAHAAALGSQVNFFSVIGGDSAGSYAQNELNRLGVFNKLLVDHERPTTLKKRYRSKGKTLLRVSQLHQNPISIEIQDKIYNELAEIIKEIDVLVFSDFNYGCLPTEFVDKITNLAKKREVLIIADSQSSSQVGNIARFKNTTLLTPTEHEARISTQNYSDGLVVLAEALRSKSCGENIFLKLGGDGLLIHSRSDKDCIWQTDEIAALNSSPVDVAGAGDSMLIAGALALALNGSVWDSAVLGSLAAAVQVSRTGNIPIKSAELVANLIR